MQKIYLKNNQRLGFTLIEILLVAAIIGLLTSTIISNLVEAQRRARDTKRIAELRDFQIALNLCYDKQGSYLITTKSIESHCARVPLTDTEFINNWNNQCGELAKIPEDPLNLAMSMHTTDDYEHYVLLGQMEAVPNQMTAVERNAVVSGVGIDTFQWVPCSYYNYAVGE